MNRMHEVWLSILDPYVFSFPFRECLWCSTAPDEQILSPVMLFKHVLSERRSRNVVFKALRVRIQLN